MKPNQQVNKLKQASFVSALCLTFVCFINSSRTSQIVQLRFTGEVKQASFSFASCLSIRFTPPFRYGKLRSTARFTHWSLWASSHALDLVFVLALCGAAGLWCLANQHPTHFVLLAPCSRFGTLWDGRLANSSGLVLLPLPACMMPRTSRSTEVCCNITEEQSKGEFWGKI